MPTIALVTMGKEVLIVLFTKVKDLLDSKYLVREIQVSMHPKPIKISAISMFLNICII